MNPTIHVLGRFGDKVHFSITRDGSPENLFTRDELRSLAKTLSEEMPLLACVRPGSDITVDVGASERLMSSGSPSSSRMK